jgi:cytochrome oxidase Cu insertion factor (SCO1/SenC/PrrC family)
MAPFALRTLDGKPVGVEDLKGRWTLLQLAPASCDEGCRQNLYHTRQVRLATGEDMNRVQRWWILTDGTGAQQLPPLLSEHPGLVVVTGDRDALGPVLEAFRVEGIDDDALLTFILDPLGNVVMYHRATGNPKDLLKDLQRLLKVSQLG